MNIIRFMKEKWNSIFYTEQCLYCKRPVRYTGNQFIKTNNRVKCVHCKRCLQAVEEGSNID